MIVIEGTVRIPPSNLEAARPVMEQMVRASRAEPGCLDYAYSVDVLDAGLVRVTERWASREALAAHFKTAHMATWRAFFPELGITDRSLRLYDAEPEPI
ncbi:MAG: antibiotic biosynthesis monooxygenase [Hyphomonas sp.]|uniref:putative quinol monooxygenase n=1 Tax=Hyphomonas sp. TaxID=87 RepID=UPI0017EC2856|nr:putative quinol monooxygenase [Hyphomonas sp.]MBU3920369.1 antibiotic biosynthesis monooxygenase [Alphaproteobacteria bacterium]MBA3070523.1 antibiotic biosynthesis monooxygenase [Hyphomonas sp.]MBU4062053.1 antibiotic biosynthesis monooxygenase [Alphaproteobacteria bacterium]MBU4164989.1 antibiotic biosynthesis monooxygenase [Alphaproteobacteria bacterium]MBU4568807.1 antibiotic biosynthesis monooxygenase [Alphaproteobacteria bacterium]